MGYPLRPMTEPAAAPWQETLAAVYRDESRRVLATLIRLLGDFDLAEEAPHDAFRAALNDSGQVCMPLGKTFFSPGFGMINDRFGVSWMVVVMP